MNNQGAANSMNFGYSNNLGENLNDAVAFENKGGFSTIGFHLVPPVGGTVAFEASFDEVNWELITLRGINSDVIAQTADTEDDFIGSIAAGRSFRVRTSVAGSAAGTVIGRAQRDAAIIETIEFGPPPDKIGYATVHKDASYTTAQTNTAFWTPASGKKFVLTDITIVVGGVIDGVLTIFDETNASGSILFKGTIDVSNNKQFTYGHAFRIPHVGASADNVMKVTTTTAMTVDIVTHGYEK